MLIEAMTYRMGSHTTSDDPTRYRLSSDVESWKLKDPIARVEVYLKRNGLADTAFFDAVAAEADDLGVHLTLNSEHPFYQWGPITHAPSLLSGGGGFPASIDDLWEHADADEVRRECRAQIERAIVWGIDVTHLAPHLSAITLRPEFFDVYLSVRLVEARVRRLW